MNFLQTLISAILFFVFSYVQVAVADYDDTGANPAHDPNVGG